MCILADTKGFAPAGATKGLSDRSVTSIVAAFCRSLRLRKAGILNRSAIGGWPFPVEKATFRAAMPAFPFGNLRTYTLWNAYKLGRLKFHVSYINRKHALFQQFEIASTGSAFGQPEVIRSWKELFLQTKLTIHSNGLVRLF